MMFKKQSKKDFYERRGEGVLKLLVQKNDIHPQLDPDSEVIEILYLPREESDDNKSYFWLFRNDEYIMNPMSFPTYLSDEEAQEIADKMLNDYLEGFDKEDLDRLESGKGACSEYGDKYICDECPRMAKRDDEGNLVPSEEDPDGCLGAMYSLPSHMNSWETERFFKDIYGEKSEKHKDSTQIDMFAFVDSFMEEAGFDEQQIREVLAYWHTHTVNDFADADWFRQGMLPWESKTPSSIMIGHVNSYMHVCGRDEGKNKAMINYWNQHKNNMYPNMKA